MSEIERIIQLFEELFDGEPWLEVTIAGTLNSLTAQQAAKRVIPGRNSIWEIVNHIIDWRVNVLKRVRGEVIITPADNYFKPVEDDSDTNWKNTIDKLADSQIQWLDFLKGLKQDDLFIVYPTNKMTYFQHIHGIIQHDAYHLGQISYLSKSV